MLEQDASTVGAYNIVPLAGIVGEFSEWVRLMEWLWKLSTFISPPDVSSEHDKASTGAQLMDRLRAEAQTGYPDIEEGARFLGSVAETSWLRQLSTWLLYGRLPSFGTSDFFIWQDQERPDELVFNLHLSLLPKFVTRETASSILFIGRSINQIRCLPPTTRAVYTSSSTSEVDLLPKHVEQLSQIEAPVAAARLTESVAKIRMSLSRNLLQHLLPRERIIEMLNVLYQFFLIGRGEFALNLIAEADKRISNRQRGAALGKAGPSVKGLLLKDAEMKQVLTRALSVLSTLSSDHDHTDEALDMASHLLHFTTHDPHGYRPGTPGRATDANYILPRSVDLSFNDLLLSVPCSLWMDIQSPLDLFITKSDLDVYSSINAYLLAFRRAHLHIAQLWRYSSVRRDHPSPPGYIYSNSVHGKKLLHRQRERTSKRTRAMRKIWATCGAAIFFLTEIEAYFLGAVVQESFKHFLSWVNEPTDSSDMDLQQEPTRSQPIESGEGAFRDRGQQHDPEVLALAHKQFLSSISYSLLLTDFAFTKTLRLFCTHVDELVAYVTRLAAIQQSLDLEEDEGVEDFSQNYKKEESEVNLELDRARRRLDGDLKNIVERLREIDNERIGSTRAGSKGYSSVGAHEMYEPLRVEGIDRLLMKLDWGGNLEHEEHGDLIDI